MICVEGLQIRFGGFQLSDIDFAVEAGESFFVLGPSGAGKSLLLEALLGIRRPHGLLEVRSDKQIEVLPMKGKNPEKLTRVRTRIKLENGGFAPVDYAFRKTEQGWKAFDVTVEGISYIITFRNQISPRVAADGIDKVTQEILAGNIKINE